MVTHKTHKRKHDSENKALVVNCRAKHINGKEGLYLMLQSKKNEHAAISWLPFKIMAQIFKLIQRDHRTTKTDNGEWYWNVICHVCRSWRGIALSIQELWSFIRMDMHSGPAQTEAYLKRSGTSQLIVHHVMESDIISLQNLIYSYHLSPSLLHIT